VKIEFVNSPYLNAASLNRDLGKTSVMVSQWTTDQFWIDCHCMGE
jgi:hypothetical protein